MTIKEETLRNKNKMEEIQFEFECRIKLERIRHDLELERGRINSSRNKKILNEKIWRSI